VLRSPPHDAAYTPFIKPKVCPLAEIHGRKAFLFFPHQRSASCLPQQATTEAAV